MTDSLRALLDLAVTPVMQVDSCTYICTYVHVYIRMPVCLSVARFVVLLRCVCRCAFRLFKFVHRAIRTIAKFDCDRDEVPLR